MNLIRTTADLGNNAIDMDNLTYTYQNGNNNSNRLMRVEDSTSVFDTNGFLNGNSGTDDYAYDANGNMTKDKNKDITSIEYNYLNLPTEITFGNGNSIEYIYSAAGVKVSKIVTDLSNTTAPTIFTDYLDGFQYVGGMLNFFPHAEGYVRATSQTEDPADPQLVFNYVYNYTDHLGNIRLSYTKDPVSNELDILEENNYYPFGLKHKVYGGLTKDYLKEEPENGGGGAIRPGVVIDGPYNYKYQGQERQDELGLNWDSFKWRNYDYAIGRFFNIDPLAEDYSYNSPYAFSENRVIDARELEGLEKVLFQKGLKNDKLFNRAYKAQRQTTGGKQFTKSLNSQSKYNVLYAPYTKYNYGASGFTIKANDKETFEQKVDDYGIIINKDQYDKISDNGEKEILIIAIFFETDKNRENAENEDTFNLASTIGHEEISHGENELNGVEKSAKQEHKDFHGQDTVTSPDSDEVLSNDKYKETKARKNLEELKEIIY